MGLARAHEGIVLILDGCWIHALHRRLDDLQPPGQRFVRAAAVGLGAGGKRLFLCSQDPSACRFHWNSMGSVWAIPRLDIADAAFDPAGQPADCGTLCA